MLSELTVLYIEEIKHVRKKRLVLVMLTVFGDESHDEKQQRIFAVAGILGSQEEWDELTPRWLIRTGGKAFHAADCESDQGEYKGVPHRENLKLYADLVKMISKTKMLGYGVAMDLEAHKISFPDVVENIPYQKCFEQVVIYFAERAYLHIPQQKVEFVFDLNSRTQASL
jgi:hypothetical protein